MSKQYYVDTSSLVCLARYYAPFDTERVIYNFLKAAFIGGAFPLLKRVFKECERVAQGIALSKYDFLSDASRVSAVVAEDHHHEKIQGWRAIPLAGAIPKRAYIAQARKYAESADLQLVVTCLENPEARVLVTEESKETNDGKPFKKIPLICEQEGITCISVVKLLEEFGLTAKFSITNPPSRSPLRLEL